MSFFINHEWWKEEPYCEMESHGTRDDEYFMERYDIPAIIEEVKRMEREREYHINCNQCGLSTSFSPNDK